MLMHESFCYVRVSVILCSTLRKILIVTTEVRKYRFDIVSITTLLRYFSQQYDQTGTVKKISKLHYNVYM